MLRSALAINTSATSRSDCRLFRSPSTVKLCSAAGLDQSDVSKLTVSLPEKLAANKLTTNANVDNNNFNFTLNKDKHEGNFDLFYSQ